MEKGTVQMPQNLYDNPEFFDAYQKLRAEPANENVVEEQPSIRSVLPAIRGKRVLDFGCGAGEFCRWLKEQGASEVTGVDVSERMLQVATSHRAPAITFVRSSAEEVSFPAMGHVRQGGVRRHHVIC